jgi:hypothetical protein
MAKLRHIAISVPDPEAAATFFERAFGMTRAGNAMRGVYMTVTMIASRARWWLNSILPICATSFASRLSCNTSSTS